MDVLTVVINYRREIIVALILDPSLTGRIIFHKFSGCSA